MRAKVEELCRKFVLLMKVVVFSGHIWTKNWIGKWANRFKNKLNNEWMIEWMDRKKKKGNYFLKICGYFGDVNALATIRWFELSYGPAIFYDK